MAQASDLDPGLTWLRGLLKEAVAKMDEGRHDARKT